MGVGVAGDLSRAVPDLAPTPRVDGPRDVSLGLVVHLGAAVQERDPRDLHGVLAQLVRNEPQHGPKDIAAREWGKSIHPVRTWRGTQNRDFAGSASISFR